MNKISAHPDLPPVEPPPSTLVVGEATNSLLISGEISSNEQSPHTSATAHVLQRGESICKENPEFLIRLSDHVKNDDEIEHMTNATGCLE